MSMTDIKGVHRGREFYAFEDSFGSPNDFTRNYPWSVSGIDWIHQDESSDQAEAAILAEARKRGADVAGDSESSQIFVYGATPEDARIIIDVCIDQGRMTGSR